MHRANTATRPACLPSCLRRPRVYARVHASAVSRQPRTAGVLLLHCVQFAPPPQLARQGHFLYNEFLLVILALILPLGQVSSGGVTWQCAGASPCHGARCAPCCSTERRFLPSVAASHHQTLAKHIFVEEKLPLHRQPVSPQTLLPSCESDC
jgi:hypothetical protein